MSVSPVSTAARRESHFGIDLVAHVSTMKADLAIFIGVLLSVALVVRAQSQPDGAVARTIAYQLGQVWTMDQGINVTILGVEDIPKIGRVVHVRVDNIPWQSCGDIHLTRMIEHVAVPEKMMLISGLALSKENTALPESSIKVLRQWQGQKQKKRRIWEAPLPALIREQGYVPGPISCDTFPDLRGGS